MEQRQSHVLVGAITFLLVVSLFAFVLWLARFSRDTTRAHQLDSVARMQVQAAQVIRQNALQNLGEDIHYAQGDSVDLGRGIIKRINMPDFRK